MKRSDPKMQSAIGEINETVLNRERGGERRNSWFVQKALTQEAVVKKNTTTVRNSLANFMNSP